MVYTIEENVALKENISEGIIFDELKKNPDNPTFQREMLLNESLKYQNDSMKQWVEFREKYAVKAERIVTRWLVFIMVIIIGQILSSMFLNKPLLTPQVLIALIAGGTVTIVGLFHTVLKGIFPAK